MIGRFSVVNLIKSQFDTIEEADKFAEWAFGPEFGTINLQYKAHEYWNAIHADRLFLKPEGSPLDDVPKMIKLWRESVPEIINPCYKKMNCSIK